MVINRKHPENGLSIFLVASLISEEKMANHSSCSVAGNKFLLGFSRSLQRHVSEFQVISVQPFQQFSFSGVLPEKIIVNQRNEHINEKVQVKQIFYLNILVLKQITIFLSIFFNLIIRIKECVNQEKVIIVYNTISYFVVPAIIVSKIFKIKTLAIIADVPFVTNKRNVMQTVEDYLEIMLIKKFDMLIPLTKLIAQELGKEIPYLVIEGGLERIVFKNTSYKQEDSGFFNIVFSGTLNLFSGIEIALKAMEHINNIKIVLNIYGKGSLEGLVKECARKNPTIVYHGFVSNSQMIEIQMNSDLLILPRVPDRFNTKYTFPSKILEYMMTGVPVLCNKLDGIPKEYYKYVVAVENPDPILWAKTIMEIVTHKKDYCKELGKDARRFVIENKMWEKHGERINRFIRTEMRDDCI